MLCCFERLSRKLVPLGAIQSQWRFQGSQITLHASLTAFACLLRLHHRPEFETYPATPSTNYPQLYTAQTNLHTAFPMGLWKPDSGAVASPQLLAGKNMAITGGVTGIGRAIVLGYLAHGANVAVNHLGDPKSSSQYKSLVEEAVESLKSTKEDVEKSLLEVPGDVGNPETGKKLVKAVVDKWGRLDVIVSNAGICEFKEFLEYVHPRSQCTQHSGEQ